MNMTEKILRSLGMEDNSQVEVNFHITTDAEADINGGNAEAPASQPDAETVQVQESVAEVDKADNETEVTEKDIDELEAAQDSLESLQVLLNADVGNGGMAPQSAGYYKVAMESILGPAADKLLSVSLESFSGNRMKSSVLAMENHKAIIEKFNVASMEARIELLDVLKHKIASVINAEKAILKKAQSLLTLAHSAGNEKAFKDTVSGAKFHHITTEDFTTDEAFMKALKKFTAIHASIGKVTNREADIASQMDEAFGRIPGYGGMETTPISFFGGYLKKDDSGKVVFEKRKDKDGRSLPTLTSATCIKVLNEVIKTTQGRSSDVETVHSFIKDPVIQKLFSNAETRPKDVSKHVVLVVNKLASNRIKVLNDILSYVQMSLTIRMTDSSH